jgi:hypothetical protein
MPTAMLVELDITVLIIQAQVVLVIHEQFELISNTWAVGARE